MDLKATVQTPSIPGEEPMIEEIPLPPEIHWLELDNSNSPTESVREKAAAPATTMSQPAVALRFIGSKNLATVPLDYPFEFDGREIHAIEVRKLTLAQVNEVLNEAEGKSVTTFGIYALMTGLPAEVLRGLVDEDARKVLGVAYDFLPQSIRTVFESSAT